MTVPTMDERRAVARRLREYDCPVLPSQQTTMEAVDAAVGCMGLEEGEEVCTVRQSLDRLADLIDPGADTTMSAYDMLPEDGRAALDWVRDHGGLDSVKKLLGWMVGHYFTEQQLDFDFWLSGRVMYELGFDEDMADRDEVERRLLARLMPEGYEWPRYEDRKPVRIGDVLSDVEVRSVVFRDNGILLSDCTSVPGWGTWRSYKEPIKRPAPKVLDADGVEIRVGDTVWYANGDGLQLTVVRIESDRVVTENARDGEQWWAAYILTHEQPDSWERLEEDAGKEACEYFAHMPCGCETSEMLDETVEKCNAAKARDLVRRARALAERWM